MYLMNFLFLCSPINFEGCNGDGYEAESCNIEVNLYFHFKMF